MLILLTIQSKSRPYRALDMASLTSLASSTVLYLTMVSPRATTLWVVSASQSSSGFTARRVEAKSEGTTEKCSFFPLIHARLVFISIVYSPYIGFNVTHQLSRQTEAAGYISQDSFTYLTLGLYKISVNADYFLVACTVFVHFNYRSLLVLQ